MAAFEPLTTILEARDELVVAKSSSSSSSRSDISSNELVQQYEHLLSFYKNESCVDALLELKQFVLEHGIPDTKDNNYGADCLRAKIWKLLLGVPLYFDIENYIQKFEDPSAAQFENKIKDDGFRTFKVNEEFWSRTNEETIYRILKVISADLGYVQGMNVLLGPFLYIMPELDSYYCCLTLLSEHIPSYIRKNLEGANHGIAMTGKCLKILDLKLYNYLISKLQDLRIFALRYVLTLMANVQPLNEVIKLWDGIFAFGAHLSIVVFCCYLVNLRDEIFAESNGYKICSIIEHGTLDSEVLLKMSTAAIQFIPADIYEELIDHVY